jgi:structure-specific recognition protein 1
MMGTYFHMQGAQYSYKINYEDIHSLFLLPKPDGNRHAFIISLDKPIRQGTQKYSHLIWEAHSIETTMSINLSEEELENKYSKQLESTVTLPLSSLIAKIFKTLSQTAVSVDVPISVR